jgi:hypothetical protein
MIHRAEGVWVGIGSFPFRRESHSSRRDPGRAGAYAADPGEPSARNHRRRACRLSTLPRPYPPRNRRTPAGDQRRIPALRSVRNTSPEPVRGTEAHQRPRDLGAPTHLDRPAFHFHGPHFARHQITRPDQIRTASCGVHGRPGGRNTARQKEPARTTRRATQDSIHDARPVLSLRRRTPAGYRSTIRVPHREPPNRRSFPLRGCDNAQMSVGGRRGAPSAPGPRGATSDRRTAAQPRAFIRLATGGGSET